MSGKLRVLHVYRSYFPDTQGGLEEVIRQVCRNAREQGVESRVFMLSENPVPAVLELEEAQVHRFTAPLRWLPAGCLLEH